MLFVCTYLNVLFYKAVVLSRDDAFGKINVGTVWLIGTAGNFQYRLSGVTYAKLPIPNYSVHLVACRVSREHVTQSASSHQNRLLIRADICPNFYGYLSYGPEHALSIFSLQICTDSRSRDLSSVTSMIA